MFDGKADLNIDLWILMCAIYYKTTYTQKVFH